jgi:hypothetical protein
MSGMQWSRSGIILRGHCGGGIRYDQERPLMNSPLIQQYLLALPLRREMERRVAIIRYGE